MENKLDASLNRLSRLGRGSMPYIATGIVLLAFHIFYDPTQYGFLQQNMRLFLIFGIACVLMFGVYLFFNGRLGWDTAGSLVMVIALLIRIGYVLITNIYTHQHDVGAVDWDGHWGYIMHIVNTWTLPDSYTYQYYHPPLHHVIAAFFFRLSELGGMSFDRAIEGVQYLTVFYSMGFVVVARRIFRQLELKGAPLFAATALIALHPTGILLSGSVNNDPLSVLFYASALLWLLRWYKDKTARNILFIALSVGLGMMTKLSVATAAFVIAPFFLIALIKGKGMRGRLIGQFAAFGAVSIPLGVWYSVRNFIKFGQPIGFVPIPGEYQAQSHVPLVRRLLMLPPSQFLERLYLPNEFGDIRSNYNIWTYTLKCSVFGEFSFNADLNAVAVLLLCLNLLLILLSLAAMIYVIRRGKNSSGKWMLLLTWVVQMVSFVMFYVKLPYSCTMDFRYIVPTLICGAGFLGLAWQSIDSTRLRRVAGVLTAGFCIASAWFYMFM